MSRFSKKRVPTPTKRDDSAMIIAGCMFGLIVLLTFVGQIFRGHTKDGHFPIPWMIYGFMGTGIVLTLIAMSKFYFFPHHAPPKILRQWIKRDVPV